MLGWLLGLVISYVAVDTIIIAVGYLSIPKIVDKLKGKRIKGKGISQLKVCDIAKDRDVVHIKLDGFNEDGDKCKFQIDAEDYDSNEIKCGTVIHMWR